MFCLQLKVSKDLFTWKLKRLYHILVPNRCFLTQYSTMITLRNSLTDTTVADEFCTCDLRVSFIIDKPFLKYSLPTRSRRLFSCPFLNQFHPQTWDRSISITYFWRSVFIWMCLLHDLLKAAGYFTAPVKMRRSSYLIDGTRDCT